METQNSADNEKHISEDSSAKDKFLTESQCRLIEYHHAVNRSLGLPESPCIDLSDKGIIKS